MKLAICDDEKRIRDMIGEAVRDVSPGIEIEYHPDATGILSKEFNADILFLDIQMPGIDGMKAAKLIRANGKKLTIVFVTALEEQVFNAFDVGAFNYIVKPFGKERIREVIKKAIAETEEKITINKTLAEKDEDETDNRSIVVKSGGTNTRVVLSDVAYAEIFDRRIVLHMTDRDDIEYYGRISDLESIVGKDYFRVHRAYLINLAYVKSYDSKYVNVMDTDIPVARGKYKELIKAYLTYHTRKEHL